MKNLKEVLNFLAKAFSLAGVTTIVGALALTVPTALATHQNGMPEWNTGTTTEEQSWFQVSNSTKGSAWGNTVTVSPGDVIAFRVFVHNNTCPANDQQNNSRDNCPQSNARHTFVKVNLPTTGGTVTATIGSDNSSPVTRDLTLTLPSGQTIIYKSGTTQITQHPYNDFGWPDLSKTEQVLGANTVTAAGLDLGDIPGCFASSKFVVFRGQVSNVVITPQPAPPAPAPAPKPQVLAAVKQLPNSGPEGLVQVLLAAMIPAGAVLRRIRV